VPRDCNRVTHEITVIGYECVEGVGQILSSLPKRINVIVVDELSAHE
jgi:predicted methyltransferase